MLKVGQAAVALSLSILSIPAGFLALSSAAVCVSSAHPALSPVVPQTSLCLNSLVSRVPAANRDAGMMLQSRVEGCFAAPSPSLPPPSPPHFPLLLLQPPPPISPLPPISKPFLFLPSACTSLLPTRPFPPPFNLPHYPAPFFLVSVSACVQWCQGAHWPPILYTSCSAMPP